MPSRWFSFPLALVVWYVCGCGSSGPPPQQITVNVTPVTITVRTGDSQQFFATVTGTTNQSVTWSVNGTPGGDTTNGTISPVGLYRPPAQVPPQNKILVAATSVADSSASQSANVTLANPIAVASFVYPPTLASNAPFGISVTGSKFVSGAQVLLSTAQLTTTFVDSSHLTATGTAPAAGVLNLTVVNPMPDGTPSAATTVPVTIVNQRAAVRFLEQSTFGPNDAQLAAVEKGGNGEFSSSAVSSTHVGCQLYDSPAGNERRSCAVPGVFPKLTWTWPTTSSPLPARMPTRTMRASSCSCLRSAPTC